MLDENTDRIEFQESKNIGTSYMSYADFQKRMEQIISKIILGHAAALDSVPGKLGSESGKDNPVTQALNDIKTHDGILVQNITNTKLIPRMRKLGFDIPLDHHFEYLNDEEKQSIRKEEDKSNAITAGIAYQMSQAGLQIDPEYFTERTGIPATLKPVPEKMTI